MKLLAVDTSGYGGSVACSLRAGEVQQRPLSTAGRRHAQTLVLEVQTLLQSLHVTPGQIDAVAVSIGPGSFTGLRVGVTFAKTFAWAGSAALVAVDTFQAIAQQAGDVGRPVAVVSDAQRQEFFFNRYTWDAENQVAVPEGTVRIERAEAVVAASQSAAGERSFSDVDGCLWTGPGIDRFAESFAGVDVADATLREPTAAAVAEIGRWQLAAGDTADPHDLEPLYIRRSYAEENAAR